MRATGHGHAYASARHLCYRLTEDPIQADQIVRDQLQFEKTHSYFRPVFAFEFSWTTANKTGVIEVDGLTGEVIENGQWFKDKIDKVLTREMLVELGAEAAGALLPGAGFAVKVLDRLAPNSDDSSHGA